jgi:carbonic anhydrase
MVLLILGGDRPGTSRHTPGAFDQETAGRTEGHTMPPAALRSAFACLLAAALVATALAGHSAPTGIPPDDALLLITDGNRRFVADESLHFQQDALRRSETANNGQKPYAVILTCSDSRVPPELIFDQGIGCLFVIRVAGNVAQNDEVASVEYGVGHLGARLIVVLGHTKCGAVTAVVDDAITGPNLEKLVKPIVPAVARARSDNPGLQGSPLVEAAIRANVAQAIADLLRLSPSLAIGVTRGQIRVVGALYDIETGKVQFFDSNGPVPSAPVESQ